MSHQVLRYLLEKMQQEQSYVMEYIKCMEETIQNNLTSLRYFQLQYDNNSKAILDEAERLLHGDENFEEQETVSNDSDYDSDGGNLLIVVNNNHHLRGHEEPHDEEVIAEEPEYLEEPLENKDLEEPIASPSIEKEPTLEVKIPIEEIDQPCSLENNDDIVLEEPIASPSIEKEPTLEVKIPIEEIDQPRLLYIPKNIEATEQQEDEEDLIEHIAKKRKLDPFNIIALGYNGTTLSKNEYNSMDLGSYTKTTRRLLDIFFSKKVLASSSLSGRPSPAYFNDGKTIKKPLNKSIIEDIVTFVAEKCDVLPRLVRQAITQKCADEVKQLRKQREV
ncbi:unnamed protein product [Brassicogethes aeneus]|uniref:BEN domain-containing protein n=1 Tax=Brassicogethes aeneus TaxID=1431903 RepID=A0A9P0BIT6_BRAAE|nr:unnamed protein product [Brassicogethes aeneus]